MAVVITIGLGVQLTPYIAEYFFPSWFGVPSTELSQVHAIRYQSAQQNRRWYQFSVERTPVERFIRRLRLQQMELNEAVLNSQFLTKRPPVDWWHPESLQRKSYFSGNDGANRVKLIYNADNKSGYLLVESNQ